MCKCCKKLGFESLFLEASKKNMIPPITENKIHPK